MSTLRIGLLAFPQMTQLDLTGPLQVFAGIPGADVRLLWKTLDPVQVQGGFHLLPNTTLSDCPPLDVICVPGGPGVLPLMEDEDVLSFLRARGQTARFVGSVCTGALVLAAAGLLHGRRATTHWASMDFLEPLGAIPVKARVVRDGKFFTGGGVTAGIDFALTMVAEMTDRATAEAIQLNIEYAPAPPFNAGSPETAPPDIVAAVRERTAKVHAERQVVVGRLAAAAVSGRPSKKLAAKQNN